MKGSLNLFLFSFERYCMMSGNIFRHAIYFSLGFFLFAFLFFNNANAQEGTILKYQKISDTQGGLSAVLDNGDYFGVSMEPIGDLDSDGITDMVAGAIRDDDGGTNRGAVYVLFLNANGTIKSEQKISDTQGGFTGVLDDNDNFGSSVASIGDLDSDGVNDIAVGAAFDDDGGTDRGAVWILFMNANGTVKSDQKISDTQGSFTGVLDDSDYFGWSVAAIGDLNLDGVSDIAVTAYQDDDGGTDRGAVWILFLNANGTVASHQKISDTQGGFTGTLVNSDNFGKDVTSIGDLDSDGIIELAVGTDNDDDGGTNRGAVWVLFMNTNGTVASEQKISDTNGSFTGTLDNSDYFGSSVSSTGDLDGDGVSDMIVGASNDDDGGINRGAAWILFLNTTGTVKAHQKISDTQGDFTGSMDNVDLFGGSLVLLGDLDGDNIIELAIGSYRDDDGGVDRGAFWIISQSIMITSVVAGDWATAATWNCNCVPDAGDIAIIEGGYEVTVTTTEVCDSVSILNDASSVSSLQINNGTLTVSRGVEINSGNASGYTAKMDLRNSSVVTINGDLKVISINDTAQTALQQSSVMTINGDLYLTESGGADASMRIRNTAVLNLNGDAIYSGTATDNAKIRMRQSSILNITGNFDRSAAGNYGELDAVNGTTVNYNGTAAQTFAMIDYGAATTNWKYGDATINNLACVTFEDDISQSSSSNRIINNLRIQTGQLNSGGFSIELGNGTTFFIDDGAKYYTTTTDATGGMVSTITTASHVIGSTSTVEFAAPGNQNVPDPYNSVAYGNVIISGGGIKILTGNVDIDGNLTINSTLDVDAANDYNIELAGNFENFGTFDERNGTVEFDGSAVQWIINSANETFYNFTLDKSGGDVLLGGSNDITILNELNFLRGDIVLGSYNLIMDVSSSVIGSPDPVSYVQADGSGVMQKNYSAVGNFTFDVGDASDYTPYSVTMNSATLGGSDFLSINVTNALHPNLSDPDHITRYWTLNSGGFTALHYDVSYFHTDADIVGTESNMFSMRWDGVWMRSFDPTNAAQNNLFTTNGYNVIPSNMDWTGGGIGALPITLVSFEVKSIGGIVNIDWVTASELNNDFFTVERSGDGDNFEIVATTGGAGTSYGEITYSLIDPQPIDGLSFYRLKQTDFDGLSETFSMVPLNISSLVTEFSVYPNPSNGYNINLSIKDADHDEILVVLYNIMGEQVYSKVVILENGSIITAIDPDQKLAKGVYLVIGSSDEVMFEKKLIIE